jgi:hypothetical protein
MTHHIPDERDGSRACRRRFALPVAFVGIWLFLFSVRAQDRAAWMQQARWGIMTHYLADWRARADHEPMSIEHWNDLVNHFDVERLADQIKSTGAGYHLLSIGQNSGYYLAPNATYDGIVTNQPSKCSRRDLVSDMAAALQKRGLRLMVYLPSGAPGGDSNAVKAFECQRGPRRNREFQLKWEAVIRDWSTRWGTNVSGWWFDGCYWPNAMYRFPEPPNFTSFAAAARAGNSNSAVAFNPGVVDRAMSISPDEDYTAGEINDLDRAMIRRAQNGIIDGAQAHFLSFLGERWGMGSPRFTADQVVAYTLKIHASDGVLTWDVPVQKNGLISQPFLDQLRAVGKAVSKP